LAITALRTVTIPEIMAITMMPPIQRPRVMFLACPPCRNIAGHPRNRAMRMRVPVLFVAGEPISCAARRLSRFRLYMSLSVLMLGINVSRGENIPP